MARQRFTGSRQRRQAVRARYERMRKTGELVRALRCYRGGGVFAVETDGLKQPGAPCITVRERGVNGELLHAKTVANAATAFDCRLVIKDGNYYLFT